MTIEILVTGGCGFIGSNFIRYILGARKDVRVKNIDLLTYAGNLANLTDIERDYRDRYLFRKGDIGDKDFVHHLFETFETDWVVHFAAESHVDRSILGPEAFVRTNVFGTFNLLEACRGSWLQGHKEGMKKGRCFLHVSTDEVYGSLGPTGRFSEKSAYDPSSPYSASKASSDHMVRSYFRTYGLPAIITHSSNNYGPYQFPEKLIPLMIHHAAKGLELPVYGDGQNVRDWLHVQDHCKALLAVLERGSPGERYNVGGNCERENREVVRLICDLLDERLGLMAGRPRTDLIRFVTDRPGHDKRYALDTTKIRDEVGWNPETSFEDGLRSTIDWYLENTRWVEDILDGTYMEFYKKQYGERLHGGKH